MILDFLLPVFFLLYAVELAVFSYAAYLARRTANRKLDSFPYPMVSVIVAAKDEEKTLESCIDSLTRLDYPHDLLEILIVNDQSSDSTPSIIRKISARFSFVHEVDAAESDTLRGKANALSQGISAATGEFIFLTDADCVVPPSWIKATLRYFDDDTGIVPGVTLIRYADKPIEGIQALDWDNLLTVGSAVATIGRPLACLGNNLAFRKKAYDDVGGYQNIKFSVTEDYALFKAIVKSGNWKYKYPMDRNAVVETLPLKRFSEVFTQRKRWATGGKETGLLGKLTLAPGFILHWLIILSILFHPTSFILFFLLKSAVDSLFLVPTLRLYGKIAHLKFILYFEIYYLVYVSILPFSVYLGKSVIWKGRKY